MTLPAETAEIASAVKGFMPGDEGEALYAVATSARPGTWLEIGTYCGKSTVLLAAAAREVGAQVEAGEPCGELESTKSVSDLVSPVSGTVVAVNDAVVDEPGTINEDPYGAGWLFTVTVSAEGDLLSAQDYADKFDAVVDG